MKLRQNTAALAFAAVATTFGLAGPAQGVPILAPVTAKQTEKAAGLTSREMFKRLAFAGVLFGGIFSGVYALHRRQCKKDEAEQAVRSIGKPNKSDFV